MYGKSMQRKKNRKWSGIATVALFAVCVFLVTHTSPSAKLGAGRRHTTSSSASESEEGASKLLNLTSIVSGYQTLTPELIEEGKRIIEEIKNGTVDDEEDRRLIKDFEQRRDGGKDAMQYVRSTEELHDALEDVMEKLRIADSEYQACNANLSTSQNEVNRLRQNRDKYSKLSRTYLRRIKARPDHKLQKKPHQIRGRQRGGGYHNESSYVFLRCNNHPRWREIDGFPGYIVKDSTSLVEESLHLPKPTQWGMPKEWNQQVFPEARTLELKINWGVHNNSQVARQVLKWFERGCMKTGDTRAMLEFRRQSRFWISRRLAVGHAANERQMHVLYPTKLNKIRSMIVFQLGWKPRDFIKEFQRVKHLYMKPLETIAREELEEQERRAAKDKMNPRPANESRFTKGMKLPLLLREQLPDRHRLRVEKLWRWIEEAGFGNSFSFEMLKLIVTKGQESTAFPPHVAKVIRTGEWGEKLWYACYNNLPSVAKALLQKRPDVVNYIGRWSEPTLFTAARLNHTECVKVLLEFGADVSAKGSGFWGGGYGAKRETALKYCQRREHTLCVQLLEEARERQLAAALTARHEQLVRRPVGSVLGQRATDRQATSLTQEAMKVMRCMSCTMPLPTHKKLPFNCESCGELQHSI